MPFSKEVFAARLRSKRAEIEISQEELSRIAGISKFVINKYENEASIPSGQNLISLCEALRCDPDYLCGWHEEQR